MSQIQLSYRLRKNWVWREISFYYPLSERREPAYVFAVVNPLDTIVQFGVKVSFLTGEHNLISYAHWNIFCVRCRPSHVVQVKLVTCSQNRSSLCSALFKRSLVDGSGNKRRMLLAYLVTEPCYKIFFFVFFHRRLQISPSVTSSHHMISLLYTDVGSHLVTQTLVSFEVPLMTRKWNRFALKVYPRVRKMDPFYRHIMSCHVNHMYTYPGLSSGGWRQRHAISQLSRAQFPNCHEES